MRTTTEASARAVSQTESLTAGAAAKHEASAALLAQVMAILDEAKAEEIVSIDLAGKSTIGDFMVIASGRSDRHVGAIGDQLQRKLKETGVGRIRAEGMETCDWVLIDIGDIIIHIFRPEVREFYKLEKMWTGERPTDEAAAH
ncbi:MAG: ribosome silencing factor [Hyphomicrobiaceae bacterium]